MDEIKGDEGNAKSLKKAKLNEGEECYATRTAKIARPSAVEAKRRTR
jgi:hypothetical protein